MSFNTSLVVLTWLMLIVLTLGLAGCLRAIRLIRQDMDERFGLPRRVQIGDTVTVPAQVQDLVDAPAAALLFVDASCSSCLRSVQALTEIEAKVDDKFALVVLWRDGASPTATTHRGLAYQQAAFDRMNVGLVPFLVVLEGSVVVFRGGVGGERSLQEASSFLAAMRSPGLQAEEVPIAEGAQ